MSENFLYEMYGVVRRKNGELLLNPLSVKYSIVEKLCECCIDTVKTLKKAFKKGNDINDIGVELLHDCLLIGLLMEGKEICHKVEYFEEYKNFRLQCDRSIYFSKNLKSWVSTKNYLNFIRTVLGLLNMISFHFEESTLLLRNAKPYNNDQLKNIH